MKGQQNGRKRQLLRDAWIGDAVLTLWARQWILREGGGEIDGPKAVRMTSNRFLGSVANPDQVEAEIGRVFEAEGLEAAYQWIEQRLLPMHRKQESKKRSRYALEV